MRTFNHVVIEKTPEEAFQALWIEIQFKNHANVICGVIYRQHNSPERFQEYFAQTLEKLTVSAKPIYHMGDFNINLLRCENCNYAHNFKENMLSAKYKIKRSIDL